jgi:hypothetical protein
MERLSKVTLNDVRLHTFHSDPHGHSIQHSVPTAVTATKFQLWKAETRAEMGSVGIPPVCVSPRAPDPICKSFVWADIRFSL